MTDLNMALQSAKKKDESTTAWIVVLAIAITCCAILFVLFANYLVTINRNLSVANARLTTMEQNESQLLYEIQSLHRALAANGSVPGKTAHPPNPPAQDAPVTH